MRKTKRVVSGKAKVMASGISEAADSEEYSDEDDM